MNHRNTWSRIAIDKIALDRRSGVPISPASFNDDGFPVIHKGDIQPGGTVNLTPRNSRYVNDVFAHANSNAMIDSKYLVVALRDLVPEAPQLGLICILKPNEKALLAQGTYAFRADDKIASPQYLVYLSNASDYRKTIKQLVVGSTQMHLRSSEFFQMEVLLPDIEEQKMIARVLKDIGKLIDHLNLQIEKKRNLKQGMMQQLCTGKKRLPGFSGHWIVKKLGEIFNITAAQSKSKYIQNVGKYFITDMGSVSTSGKLIVTKQTNFEGDVLDYGDLIMPKDDIGGGNIIGRIGFIDKNNKYILGDHVYRLKLIDKNADSLFLSYLINSYPINMDLRKKVSGSAQLGLGRKSVEEQELRMPKLKEEQTAIAAILSDMGAEIKSLEQKRDKYTMLKQGMMQELLTGRIRLI